MMDKADLIPAALKKPRSVMWKMLTITILTLLLLIPLSMIGGVIAERQFYRDEVISEIAATWAGQQIVLGPVLVVPYQATVQVVDAKGQKQTQMHRENLYILPNSYSAKNRMKPETRYRGIYKSVVYINELNTQGNFTLDALKKLDIPASQIEWNNAFVAVGLSETKGLHRAPNLKWNGKTIEMLSGVNTMNLMENGLHAPVTVDASMTSIPFNLEMSFKGSQVLSIVPVGKQSVIEMASTWTSPSFAGSTLPTQRNVDSKGFTARWDIPYFVRNVNQAFVCSEQLTKNLMASQVGVNLITPVDTYQQSERATKYGILFLVLTFATYFLFEIMTRTRIHPFQYLLVGFGMSLFYLLLLALSEVIGFNWAYALASTTIIGMLAGYSRAILGKVRKYAEFMIAGLLAVLYGYLYILLQLEDYSLLFGALGLVAVLGTLMFITRNIDWYNDSPEPVPSMS